MAQKKSYTKKIIIPRKKLQLIWESIENENKQGIPAHILKALKSHNTSLGDNPAFPPEDEHPFDYKITKRRFDDLSTQIASMGFQADENSLKRQLNKLITKCQKIEEPLKLQLERICLDSVLELFAVPNDSIDFTCELVTEVDGSNERFTPEEDDEGHETEFDGIDEIEGINNDIYKRRLTNALVQGASLYYTMKPKEMIGKLYELNPTLPSLYHNILLINDYLSFIENENVKNDPQNLGGNVNIRLGDDENIPSIEAKAIIFPVLMYESIKGFMELFSSHGLPTSKNKASYVLKKADFLLAEPWDMRLGYGLWKLFLQSLPENVDTKEIPYIFTELVSKPCDDFNPLMKEIFAKTRKGKETMKQIYDEITYQLEYEDFEDFLAKQNEEGASLDDEYFNFDDIMHY